MYRIWYWATIDRESDGRYVASIPDLDDVAAWGSTESDAKSHAADLAAERVRAAVDEGRPIPRRRRFSEMPHQARPREVARAMIPVAVARTAAWPTPPYDMSS